MREAYVRLSVVNLVPNFVPNLIPKSKNTGQGSGQSFLCRTKSHPRGIRRIALAVELM